MFAVSIAKVEKFPLALVRVCQFHSNHATMLTSIVSSLRPMLVVASITGYFLFTIDTKAHTAVVKIHNVLAITLAVIVNFFICCSFWHLELFFGTVHSEIAKASMPILVSIDHTLLVFIMVWSFCKRHRVVRLLAVLADIDVNLSDLGVRVNYERQKKALIIAAASLVVITVAMVIFASVLEHDIAIDRRSCFVIFWLFVAGLVYICQFTVGMNSIGMRFEMMNCCIEHHRWTCIASIHLKIVEIVKIFNSIFGFPMLLSFANLFAWNCMTAFTFAMLPVEKLDVGVVASMVFNFLFTAGSLFVMINAAEKITRAKEAAVELLFRAMAENCSSGEKIQGVLMQILNTNVSFSCRLFDFNWKMLFNVS
jgi:large-conductance mechanosensitive channel